MPYSTNSEPLHDQKEEASVDLPENLSFEEALVQLENITNDLEKGNLSLEESILAYDKGMKLSELCSSLLKKAEGKLQKIEKDKEQEDNSSILADIELEGLNQKKLFG